MSNTNQRFVLEWGPTAWSKILPGRASNNAALAARTDLLLRYHEVVYEYFLQRLHNESAAAELYYSEFAVRLLETDRLIRNADPQKGRFRDYLQTALWHMIADYYRERGKRLPPLASDVEGEPGTDVIFGRAWKDEMITRAWKALEQYERDEGHLSYSVLLPASENGKVSAREVADLLGKQFGRGFRG
jgi:RNA polymerase sigma-70 factor (ECF subfamily)